MSFIESPSFPDSIGFSAVGGAGFSTNVVTLASGYESRNINWTSSRYGYDLALPVRTQSEVDVINAFFRSCQGRATGFRFKDWSDFQAVKQSTVTLTTKTFQMQKVYTSGSSTNTRKIQKPVLSTVKIYVANIEATSGWSVDGPSGVITFIDEPSGAVTWSGNFEVPVRFDIDELKWRVVDRGSDGLLYQCEALPLVEVRI